MNVRKNRGIISIFLAIVLVLGCAMPITVFAAEEEVIQEDNNSFGVEKETEEEDQKGGSEGSEGDKSGEDGNLGGGTTGGTEGTDKGDLGVGTPGNTEDNEVIEEEIDEDETVTNLAMPMLLSLEDSAVMIMETEERFDTLGDAIAAAAGLNLEDFTVVITDDVIETGPINIESNVTIVGKDGQHKISLTGGHIRVLNGGKLTLGDENAESIECTECPKDAKCTENTENLLTIEAPGVVVNVTDGNIKIYRGVKLIGNNTNNGAVYLNGPNASGSISGGIIEGNSAAIAVLAGAQISEISGGKFYGKGNALYMSGQGTMVDLISGGRFYQTDLNVTLHGHGIYIQDHAKIGTITGGYFHSVKGSALVVIAGAQIEEISGGEFVVTRVGNSLANSNTAVRVLGIAPSNSPSGSTSLTKIGTISGGRFNGTNYGMLVIQSNNNHRAQIDRITGGTFTGTTALQNDRNCVINEITGGSFIGSHGMLNVGEIGKIGGNALFHGEGQGTNGIYALAGKIDEISGGIIRANSSEGIAVGSGATIDLISGGTIIGRNAIRVYAGGTLNKITGGVFLGQMFAAIRTVSSLTLEPDLTDEKRGNARFWGAGGQVFHNDDVSMVTFPDGYSVSTNTLPVTLPVEGIKDVRFKYLTLPDVEFLVTVDESHSDSSGAGIHLVDEIVTINAGTQEGFIFAGWTCLDDDVVFADSNSATTTFTMPPHAVTVTATWVVDNGNNGGGDSSGGSSSSGGGSGGGSIAPPVKEPENPFVNDHIWYIQGFPDGEVKPSKSITRAEISMILFRLIKNEAKELSQVEAEAEYSSQTKCFSDVEADSWYAEAVNYLACQDIISGYPDGTFRPHTPMTRAELAAVMSRFFEMTDVSAGIFEDVSSGHWAFDFINNVYDKGWVEGYEDGTFRPDNPTSRAEAVTMLNRLLGRRPNPNSIREKLNQLLDDNVDKKCLFNDITDSHWAYYDLVEAATDHSYYADDQGLEVCGKVDIPWLTN